jgi:hypothetical protein
LNVALDEGLCFLWNLLSLEEARASGSRNRLRRAILKVRARIAHALDQKKILKSTPKALSRRMEVGNGEYAVLRLDFWRALECRKITREEYMRALMIIGQSPGDFNALGLAEKIAVTEMAADFGTGRSLE